MRGINFIDQYATHIISCFALLISALSLWFSVRNWRESNRPIVTARVTTQGSGNMGVAFNLTISNIGNKAAKDIKLTVPLQELDSALAARKGDSCRNGVEACFSDKTFIPILEPGAILSNSFGFIGVSESTWKPNSIINIGIFYSNLRGKIFNERLSLLIANDSSFAGSSWSST